MIGLSIPVKLISSRSDQSFRLETYDGISGIVIVLIQGFQKKAVFIVLFNDLKEREEIDFFLDLQVSGFAIQLYDW